LRRDRWPAVALTAYVYAERAAVIDDFGAQLVVPAFVAVDPA
jgi:hypothetical protein